MAGGCGAWNAGDEELLWQWPWPEWEHSGSGSRGSYCTAPKGQAAGLVAVAAASKAHRRAADYEHLSPAITEGCYTLLD